MFSHPVYLFLREFSLQDFRGGSIGCHESKISRTDWRFIASVLCAFGMASDISPISRAFKYALDEITKKKSPAATEDFKQIDMQF
ncbi:CII family transcriptional regulator [Escherichia coli]|uniref:CII family transcriptional regulator n=1 Tax=Escherichia coli TaxID=562 RepID=UPI002852E6B5|nr:CII family transcriptional regulator [Escherichia coli]